MQLYKIKDEYLRALDELNDIEGITLEIIEDSLCLIKEQVEEKALNVAAYIKNLSADLATMNEYKKSMQERIERLDNKISNLENYLIKTLEVCNIKKVPGIEFNVSLRPTSRVIIDDESLLKEWTKIKTDYLIDKMGIKKAFSEGKEVKGAHLEHDFSLIIK